MGLASFVSLGKPTSGSSEGRLLGPTRTCLSILQDKPGGIQGPAGFPGSAEGLFPAVWRQHLWGPAQSKHTQAL